MLIPNKYYKLKPMPCKSEEERSFKEVRCEVIVWKKPLLQILNGNLTKIMLNSSIKFMICVQLNLLVCNFLEYFV